MTNPAYSICIPVYKRTYGFYEALQSAVLVRGCQEIVVVDDHSDHTEFKEICDSFQDSRISYYKNEQNLGLFANWNRSIERAKGEFVSVLCSDDIIEPDAWQLFLDVHQGDPSIDVFFGSFCTFTDSIEGAMAIREFPHGRISGTDLIKDVVRYGPGFPVLSVMRRSAVLKFPFVSKPHSGNDWLWIYENASSLNLYAVDRPINYWRRHPEQDAKKSQSITTDCWPLMYLLIGEQLESVNDPLSGKALRRAKGVVLNWLLNDYRSRTGYYLRLSGDEPESNYFLGAALKIISGDWLLLRLLRSERRSFLYYNLGRLVRKAGYYPHS